MAVMAVMAVIAALAVRETPSERPASEHGEVALLRAWLARTLLKAMGWKIEGQKPLHRKYVLIAAPHTSNWDFPMMILCAWAFDVSINWMGKQSLFRPPLGWIMRGLGGIPVQRGQAGRLVADMVAAFAERDAMVLAVPTEGTRARAEHWKSGFYHIARGAGVPIVPSYLDYGRKRAGFGPALPVSGDVRKDMDLLRGFYAPMQGRFPENFSPVRLREEESAPEEPDRPYDAAAGGSDS
jgi:1-acyl-sn-glycerol-3-phosphate acyltransferase